MAEKAPVKKLDDQMIVRMSNEVKTAFMQKAKSHGRSGSSLIMDFIMSYINEEDEPVDVVKIKSEVDELREKFKAMEAQLLGKYAA